MNPNWIGVVAGLATFAGIWFGHVSVRRIERGARSIAPWAAAYAAAGLLLETAALFASSPALSAAAGILGMTALWDVLELYRQAARVRRGHAPANPSNARHARILNECGAATTVDLLARRPIGRRVSPDEAAALVSAGHSRPR